LICGCHFLQSFVFKRTLTPDIFIVFIRLYRTKKFSQILPEHWVRGQWELWACLSDQALYSGCRGIADGSSRVGNGNHNVLSSKDTAVIQVRILLGGMEKSLNATPRGRRLGGSKEKDMSDITSLGYPLVYKAHTGEAAAAGVAAEEESIMIRAEVRALTGMQKEALVHHGSSGTVWRMVSDEGPYLNGTDLAPFPLAFYTTGMAFSFTDELLKHAAAAGVTINRYRLVQDNYYTMQGSAIRGDMIGGALPVEMEVAIEAEADDATIRSIVKLAGHTSPAQRYMEQRLANSFSLHHNGSATPVTDVAPSPQPLSDDPTSHMEAARPVSNECYAPEIITKLEAAEPVFGVEGGAGSSLQATQKRRLHVRGECTLREDGMKEVVVQLFRPLGSSFRFIGDDTPEQRAPSSLAYLAAGIGFCYMTQIGRYAHIMKHELHGYSIVQETGFRITADSAKAAPVDTHTFLTTGEEDEAAQRTLGMSERTCFLHAAMRDSNQSRVRVTLNGRALGD
jgi:hypothetical protein